MFRSYLKKSPEGPHPVFTEKEWKSRCSTCFLLGMIAGCIVLAVLFVIFAPELFGFSFFSAES
ncbi:hypothetical protein ED312_04705 [Sinomicrobium pectinilyticum]|uniref:Uncharacterized protein n=1 Tax=Sinomicrobium pectinilyticum TaxID=1084421 RepID=A0A3N0EU30_SINP1|nr:hypothetical protein ED312_04705 [Sinomicrobium pectinilyticum]